MGLTSQKKRSLFSVLFHSKASKSVSEPDKAENNNNADDLSDNTTGSDHWSSSDDESSTNLDKNKKSTSNTSQDQDSYVLDLNKRLVSEKLKPGECSDDEEEDSLKKSAKEEANQIVKIKPVEEVSSEKVAEARINEPANHSEGPRTNRSPLLEQFLRSHKIPLDSLGALPEMRRSEPDLMSSSSSDRSSLVSVELRSEEFERALLQTPIQDRAARERDLRLVHWRLKAAKSIWSANSLPSSDSELDLLDCQSPALVISCSDDTSCSSVELIWSPRETVPVGAKNDVELSVMESFVCAPDERQTNATIFHEISPLNRCHTDNSQTPLSNRQRILHRLSIFELAKPSRAKGKRTSRDSPKLTDDAQWVPNPLFGVAAKDNVHRLHKSASHESVVAPRTLESVSGDRDKLERAACSLDEDIASGSMLDEAQPEYNESNELAKMVKGSERNRSPATCSKKRDKTYLNHIINLDRRIKSNVSSIKSQLSVKLSDTSKRASMMADNLITSIKDTTKEQLFSGWPTTARTTSNSINSSSFSIPQNVDSTFADSDSTNNKARLFSLIYMHQQQANGQPVITRQPMPTGGLTSSRANNPLSASPTPSVVSANQTQSTEKKTPKTPPPRPAAPKARGRQSENTGSLVQNPNSASKADINGEVKDIQEDISPSQAPAQDGQQTASSISVGIQTSPVPVLFQEQTASASKTSNSLTDRFLRRQSNKRFLITTSASTSRRRKYRRPAKIAPSSDEDDHDEDFYNEEYTKLKSSLTIKDDFNLNQSQIRTLNYWRRFKMRKLGTHHSPTGSRARDRSHSLDLSDLRRTDAL